MSALPHLLQRLRRWWALACWRTRIAQIDQAITTIEHDLAADAAVLSSLRQERAQLALQLAAAQQRVQ